MPTVASELRKIATPAKAKASAWFFKTGPGQYGEGDMFLGVTVPEQRKIAKIYKDLPLAGIESLITSPWHEERLVGLFILVGQYSRASTQNQKLFYDFYISHTKWINNWDLVDSSAEFIVGPWLADKPEKLKVLEKLADSEMLWEKRIAMIATFHYIKAGQADAALLIAGLLLNDKHDLIQKAVGWMLREVGKRVDRELLIQFLDLHAATMPRTALRYAIEHLPPTQRIHYLDMRIK